ncbi:MAG TPA: copper resistance protein B [Vitreimonas sp.]|uniref:copper resistance protein B n=1 Tax=Vitreimonas sp. TaxID=3069702 RepID=UPI002D251D4E|nr:copper resistance protein B [Vitreimonas sp.]HYD89472.1 copper resistance protein B [Vitreimonas sp.]
MRWRVLFAFAAPLVMATPVLAQTDPPAMQMPWPTAPPQTQPPAESGDEDDADHSHMDHGAMDHAQMGHGAGADSSEVGNEPAPEAPADHAAERFYSADEMEAARAQLRREHGGAIVSTVMVDLAELHFSDDETSFHWEGEGWIGGDINRFVFKTEGEANEDDVESAEVQALYSRAIGPYFDLQAGVRYDIEPRPSRVYAVLGFEGVAPYWFETTGALFVSDEGELSARFESSYDARLTQRWILQPRVEINLSADDIPELGVGAGFTEAGLGLRLRYDITRTFSPYVGVSYETSLGDTADYATADSEDVAATQVVVGVRTRF